MEPKLLWKPSLFNMMTCHPDGSLLIVNSLSGGFVKVNPIEVDYVSKILEKKVTENIQGILAVLAENGILVPSSVDELQKASNIHNYLLQNNNRLSLTLLPTMQCNFRCTYCYEDFEGGRMSKDIIDSIIQLIYREVNTLQNLSVSWFGGEPLIAMDIIENVSNQILTICQENDIDYSASMTTNGYLLTEKMAERCFSMGIKRFQITLDGAADTHDTLRVLANGDATFDTILENLLNLYRSDYDFHIRIRVNFTPETIPSVPKFITFLGEKFGGDSRFSIYFRGVGNWGGEHDDFIKVCDQTTADEYEIHFMSLSMQAGFSLDLWKEALQPFGGVCYAADPRSFIVGSDGSLYKCTVAFNDPLNQIGKIDPDGVLNIEEGLHRLWISSGEEVDTVCQTCAFRPACQGNSCPYIRIQNSERQCPREVRSLDKILPLLADEALSLSKIRE